MLISIALIVGACSGADDGNQTGDGSEASPDAPSVETSEPVVEIDPAYASLVDALDGINLTTPESGGGERPILAWEPVDGADHYTVVVLGPDGQPYWGWTTEETRVRVGVGDRADAVPGPRVAEGMTWSVVATDATGVPIAASTKRPIAP